jgi:transposase
MRNRTFHLSDDAIRELEAAYRATKDGAERTRLQAVRLYGQGYAVARIRSITGTPRSSLMDWCRAYRVGGVDALADHRLGGNSAKLTPEQIADLSSKLRLYTPRSLFGSDCATQDGQFWTLPDLKRAVEFWYSVIYQSPTSYYNLFARCGYSYHQPSSVFKSRRETAVADFEARVEKN